MTGSFAQKRTQHKEIRRRAASNYNSDWSVYKTTSNKKGNVSIFFITIFLTQQLSRKSTINVQGRVLLLFFLLSNCQDNQLLTFKGVSQWKLNFKRPINIMRVM